LGKFRQDNNPQQLKIKSPLSNYFDLLEKTTSASGVMWISKSQGENEKRELDIECYQDTLSLIFNFKSEDFYSNEMDPNGYFTNLTFLTLLEEIKKILQQHKIYTPKSKQSSNDDPIFRLNQNIPKEQKTKFTARRYGSEVTFSTKDFPLAVHILRFLIKLKHDQVKGLRKKKESGTTWLESAIAKAKTHSYTIDDYEIRTRFNDISMKNSDPNEQTPNQCVSF